MKGVSNKSGKSISLQGEKFAAVVASDSTEFDPSALYVGVGGTVVVADILGNSETFLNVPDGTFLPITATKVLSTGTTATNIVRVY